MADYILLRNSDDHVLEEADSTRFRKTGVPPVLKSEKGIRWLSLVIVDPPLGQDQVKEGPTVETTDTTYTRTWTVRDKTEQELEDEKGREASTDFAGMKSLINSLNDGSFIPDSDYTEAEIKDILKAQR